MNYPKVRIVASGNLTGTEVYLDDQLIRGVTDVRFSHPVGDLPRVILSLLPAGVELVGNAKVEFE